MRRRWAALLGVPLLTLALLEVGACVLTQVGMLPTEPPRYGRSFWQSGDPRFGVWRLPNATHRHRTACFDVTLRSSSIGTRDRERALKSNARRVVVLGDSFMAGWGVEEDERVSNLLEQRLGIPHLNFAMDAFGPYQSLLVYRELASHYDHDVVLLGLLPENDLVDIDFEQSRRLEGYTPRFRPYLVGTPPDLERYDYREPLVSRFLRQVSYLYKTVLLLAPSRMPEGRAYDEFHAQAPSWFYDFQPDQAARLEEVLTRLAHETRGKTLVVALLPVEKDLLRFTLSGPSPLARRLTRLARKEHFLLVNLLPPMAAQGPEVWSTWFHSCDYHWSPAGHRAAADLLEERLWRHTD